MLDNLPETIRLELIVRLLLVFVTFSLAILLRNFVAWLLAAPLKRLFVRAGQDGLNDSIRRVIVAPTGYLLLALALDISARILGASADLLTFVGHVTRTLVIISVALMISPLIRISASSRRRLYTLTGILLDEALLPFVGTGIQLFIWALVLVLVIQVWGYDVTGLIAGLGIGGLAISLAAQDTLSNLFGFAAIVSDRPFVVGEYIKTKDVEGLIERVGLRSTRVRQMDQAVVSVPNSLLASSPILNWSRLARRKMELTLGLSYRTDADAIEALLERLRALLAEQEHVDPESIVVFFTGFGQSVLNILIRCYLDIADWTAFTAQQEHILIEIMRLVERMGLQLAVPIQSVVIENVDELAAQMLREPSINESSSRLPNPRD